MEAHHIEHADQKARREVKAKAKEEAEKQKIAEEKKKKLEYTQQLQDKVIVEDAVLLEGSEGFQVTKSKYKEVIFKNKERYWPFKKAKGR